MQPDPATAAIAATTDISLLAGMLMTIGCSRTTGEGIGHEWR